MSTLTISVERVSSVEPHPNADSLDIVVINGWQTVTKRGGPWKLEAGDEVLYIPVDAMVPLEWAEQWGVVNYLHFESESSTHGRVRAVKLRGEPSYGFAVPLRADWPTRNLIFEAQENGQPLAEAFDIRKYEPPVRSMKGDQASQEEESPYFPRYTEIENLRHYTNVLESGEPVIITEKIHGTNSRVGYSFEDGVLKMHAGSRKYSRRDPGSDKWAESLYWYPLTLEPIQRMMLSAAEWGIRSLVVYGEIYGPGVQKLQYGVSERSYVVFDIMAEGKYLDPRDLAKLSVVFDLPMVPLIGFDEYNAVLPYSIDLVRDAARGKSLMDGADHIREGVVVRPIHERYDHRVGRVILKWVSDDYLTNSKLVDADTTDA